MTVSADSLYLTDPFWRSVSRTPTCFEPYYWSRTQRKDAAIPGVIWSQLIPMWMKKNDTLNRTLCEKRFWVLKSGRYHICSKHPSPYTPQTDNDIFYDDGGEAVEAYSGPACACCPWNAIIVAVAWTWSFIGTPTSLISSFAVLELFVDVVQLPCSRTFFFVRKNLLCTGLLPYIVTWPCRVTTRRTWSLARYDIPTTYKFSFVIQTSMSLVFS